MPRAAHANQGRPYFLWALLTFPASLLLWGPRPLLPSFLHSLPLSLGLLPLFFLFFSLLPFPPPPFSSFSPTQFPAPLPLLPLPTAGDFKTVGALSLAVTGGHRLTNSGMFLGTFRSAHTPGEGEEAGTMMTVIQGRVG